MIFRCRQFEVEGSEREVEAGCADMAPDLYVKHHVETGWVGATTFVEVWDDGQWQLWSVECVLKEAGLIGFLTAMTTAEDVHREMRESMQ